MNVLISIGGEGPPAALSIDRRVDGLKNGRFEDYELARVVTDNLTHLKIVYGDLVRILETYGDGYLVQAVNMNHELQMPWGGAEHGDLEPSDGTDENGNSLIRPIPGPP